VPFLCMILWPKFYSFHYGTCGIK